MIVVLVLVAIPALSLLFLQNRQVQTMVTRYVAEQLSGEVGAHISLSSVSYSFFRRVQVRDLYMEDIHGDTLIYVGLTKMRIKQFRPEHKGLTIGRVTVEDVFVNLVIDSTNKVNISYITDQLRKPHVPPELKSRVHFGSIELKDGRFSLTKLVRIPGKAPISFTDYHLGDLQVSVEDLEVARDTVTMNVLSLTCKERSGFHIDQIATQLSINKRFLHFDDLEIETAGSDLDIPRLWFDFESYKNFKRFSYLVDLQFESSRSDLSMEDLAYHVHGTNRIFDRISLDGAVNGRLSDLKGDGLTVTFDDQSTLAFDFTMIGLPVFRNTFLDFSFRELNTSVLALNSLVGVEGDSASQALYPWINLGNLGFTGHFTGYPDHFVASGLLATDLGRMVVDLSFKPDSVSGIGFNGHLRTRDFRLGTFFGQEKYLGQLDMNVLTGGHLYKGRISADLAGTIDTLEFYDYAYSNIDLDGAFTNTTFNGGFSITDPNIKLDFLGRMDFSGEVPEYRFSADVARARPHFLNLPQPDPNYFTSFLVETDLSGRTLDELNGELTLVNSLFERTGDQVQLYDLTITTRNNPQASLIQVRSDLIDVDLTGQYRLTDLPRSFRHLADRYLNVVPHSEPVVDTSNYFTFLAQIKHLNPLLDFFIPGLQLGDQSTLSGTYDLLNNHVKMEGAFPFIQYGKNIWHQVGTSAHTGIPGFEFLMQADSMSFGEAYVLRDQEFTLLAADDTAHAHLSWDNRSVPAYKGEIRLHGAFQPDSLAERGFLMDLEPGSFTVNDMVWSIHPSQLLLKREYFGFRDFEMASLDKRIKADGVISSRHGDDFRLEMERLNLAAVPAITGINAELRGEISGDLSYHRQDGTPVVASNLKLDSLQVNQQYLGHTVLDARWKNRRRSVGIRLLSEADGNRVIDVNGDYVPDGGILDFDIRLRDIQLEAFNRYTSGVFRDLDGTGTVNMTLDGTLEKPELNGTMAITSGAATLSYLNTRYHFDDRVRIYRNNIYMEDFALTDKTGNGARINGSISNSRLRDFYINLSIDADNILCMNTLSSDNEDLYGTIYGTGQVIINGPPSNLKLNVNASTERNTALFLPLYTASEVVSSDFLTFISEDVVNEPVRTAQETKIRGIQMDLEVGVTNDAVVQLIFDPKVGDIIETSGNGNLRILLDPANGLRLFGDVELEKGEYLFTLQNVINKRFKIEPGGHISFNGSPTNTSIDLKAIYTTRAAPYNLYPDHDDTRESLKKRIPVECQLNLQGELESPAITPGITMPTADAETRNLLENSTSTEEDLMKQFLSLLVINNFYSVTGYGGGDVGTFGSGAIAGVTASELFSNQLSNWLSQISDDFDIGINYRPGDEITSDEVEVALSTQLLNDRIIISGNVDVGGQETNPSEGASNNPYIMGDFDVEFRVTDNVSVIAFNRARYELLFETAPYKQGVGISYREEFDDVRHLFTRIRERTDDRKKRRKKKEKEGTGE